VKIQIKEAGFKNNILFENSSLILEKPGCYALVGENGTGKTTLLKIISGLYHGYSGLIEIGKNEKISCLIDGWGFPESYTGTDVEYLLLDEKEQIKFDELSKELGVSEYAARKIRSYSLGMRNKFAQCLIFSRDANVILLDEPFNGIDEKGKAILKSLIKKEKKGKILIVSTHFFEDLSTYADKVILLENKKLNYVDINKSNYTVLLSSPEEAKRFSECLSSLGISNYLSDDKVNVNIKEGEEGKLMDIIRKFDVVSFGRLSFSFSEDKK
jgi:ABC-2 type transport system ATP-binding protein